MGTFIGGPENNTFRLRSADRSTSVYAGGGEDVLEVDWSGKSSALSGFFDDRSGSGDAFLDDPASGVQINGAELERLVVRFGSGDDRFALAGTALAELDGGLGTDVFQGDFRTLGTSIAFALNGAADALSVIGGQGSTITNFEQVRLFTGAGDDELTGGSLDDFFSAGGGANRVSGGAGDDQIVTGGGVNTVLGGEGDDRWSGDYRASGALTLTQAGAASYALSDGSSVSEVETVEVSLGAGDDVIELRQGVRVVLVNAGAGRDVATIDWSGATDPTSGSFGGPAGLLQLVDAIAGRRITITEMEALNATFGSGDDRFSMIAPLAGALDGGGGTDFFYGDLTGSTAGIRFAVTAMAGAGGAAFGELTLRNFESVELRTGSGADTLSGGALDDRFFAGAGNDTIRAGGGTDVVYGGGGDDLVEGGAGGDQLFGEAGTDTLSYATARAAVTVSLAVTTAQATGGGGTDLVEGFENLLGSAYGDSLTGSGRANVLTGGDGDDRVVGLGGNDGLNGGAGDDALLGGAGADTLFGDAGNDALNGGADGDELYGGIGADVLVGGDGGDYLEGFDGNDVLRGDAGADFVDGGAGDDQLLGGEGNDRLFGGMGSDRLQGGAGADVLAGQEGADRFIFADGDFGLTRDASDSVEDFSRADRDRLDLRLVDADTAAAGDQAFTFLGGGAFTGTAGELRYEADATGLFVEGDTDGDGAADLFIRIEAAPSLVSADLLL